MRFARDPTPPPPTSADAVVGSDHRMSLIPTWVDALFASAAIGVVAGAANGFVVGGIGGRLAMRILVLTSDDAVRGITSDDGFEIGRFSADTIALLVLTTILGGVAGGVFGFLRMFVAGRPLPVTVGFAVTCSSIGGAVLVQSDGIDFRFLGPLWLAVGLFVAIPGIWGVAMVISCERLTSHPTLLNRLPTRMNEKRWGVIGWTVLLMLTIVGLIDLVNDIATLRT